MSKSTEIVFGCILGVIISIISILFFILFAPFIIVPFILPTLLLIWYLISKSNFVKFLLVGSLVGLIPAYLFIATYAAAPNLGKPQIYRQPPFSQFEYQPPINNN
ncbi:MAG: hypothetical protein Q8P07_04020 [bacterium]|nr:hypothetical protein [bacterium]